MTKKLNMPEPYEQVNVWYGGGGLVECHLPEKYFKNKNMDYSPQCIQPLKGTFIEDLGNGKASIMIEHPIDESAPFLYSCNIIDDSGYLGYDEYAWSPKPVLKNRFQLLKDE
ncbi:MAG: hypothetical protein IMZ64_02360 [Bacteroidetes bacterium]|nr:hypothetical protein [Bacteroidota bacterium]